MHQPYRIRYRKRKRLQRPQVKFWIGVAIALALGIYAAVTLFSANLGSRVSPRSVWLGALNLGRNSGRSAQAKEYPIYPYSIIAGGVHNKQQFLEAMKDDPVAAAHYANFNPSNFHIIKLKHAKYAYVSFRVGDNVYWTRNKLKLNKGETLITDGKHYGKTRCGNRLSATARLPHYRHEPTAKELNAAQKPKVETEAFSAIPPLSPLPLNRLSVSNQPFLSPPGPGGHPSGFVTPSGPPIFGPPFVPLAGCSQGQTLVNGKCTSNTPPNTPPPPPVAPTPENTTWLLFLTGAVIVYAMIRKHQSQYK